MFPRIEPPISSSGILKPCPLATLEGIVPASSCTLEPKEEGAASWVDKDQLPFLPRLAYVTVARSLGRRRRVNCARP